MGKDAAVHNAGKFRRFRVAERDTDHGIWCVGWTAIVTSAVAQNGDSDPSSVR